AVRAEEAGDHAGLDARGEVRDRGDSTEVLREVGELDQLSVGHLRPLVTWAVPSIMSEKAPDRAFLRNEPPPSCDAMMDSLVPVTDNAAASRILVRVEGALGRLTLTRPEAINALSLDMIRDLSTALERWRTDSDVQIVLIDG